MRPAIRDDRVSDTLAKIRKALIDPTRGVAWQLLVKAALRASITFIPLRHLFGPVVTPTNVLPGSLPSASLGALFLAFAGLPIATAITIFRSKPPFPTLLAGQTSRESIGRRRFHPKCSPWIRPPRRGCWSPDVGSPSRSRGRCTGTIPRPRNSGSLGGRVSGGPPDLSTCSGITIISGSGIDIIRRDRTAAQAMDAAGPGPHLSLRRRADATGLATP